ncbi:MAG: RIP metalloprotease RseP [Planctomycetota bacterium]
MPDPFVMLAFLDNVAHILVVALGIGFLIFVHELGHFAVAKWNKVRVEAFSLGFGPVIWGFWKGETHYRLSLVPLGGYVKMAGETAADEHTNDPAEFLNKSIPVRAAVLVAGVVMNTVIGIALFVFAFNIGVPLIPPVAGGVRPGSPAAAAGIQAEDRILTVDGAPVLDFHDLVQEIAYADGPVDLLVERDGEEVLIEGVQPVRDPTLKIQRVGIKHPYSKGIHVDAGSAAEEAGLQTGDVLVRVGGIPVGDAMAAFRAMSIAASPVEFVLWRDGSELTLDVTPTSESAGTPIAGVQPMVDRAYGFAPGSRWGEIGLKEGDRFVSVNGTPARSIPHARSLAGTAAPAPVVFVVEREGETVTLPAIDGVETAVAWVELFDAFAEDQVSLKTTKVTLVDDRRFEDGNPARTAGLPEGAELVKIAGKPVKQWSEVQSAIHGVAGDEPVEFTFRLGEGEEQTVSVLRRRQVQRNFGVAYAERTEIIRREGLGAAVGAGLRRSVETGLGILRMLGGIVTGKVSAKALGGPIAISTISYRSAKKDIIHFLYFLGILSINLAILNILPIPVLDGGHLLFLVIEAIRRKPLPDRAMAMFQWAGFLFLILLMVFVVFNDIERMLG